MEEVAIIDFETTGLSPGQGARATEIAAIVVREGKLERRYQSLMNAGVWVPSFITQLTGITNDMVKRAPPAARVMGEVADFVGDLPLVAHNASFDSKFWEGELAMIGRKPCQEFACTMLAARRIVPDAPNHRLTTLSAFMRLPDTGRAHRAMADAETAAHLLLRLESALVERYAVRELSHALMRRVQRAKVGDIERFFRA
ncbi:MAG: 3'-5' exonuclease [Magnetococcales bacterium]|nr:3'-5' exonuclease [Magnetococcales bacterium]